MSIAGKNLKYLRKLRGWTQEEFAAKLKIKRSLLGAYEEERADPRIDVLEVVGDIFKLTLDELLRKELNESKGSSYIARRRAQKLAAASNSIFFVYWLNMNWIKEGSCFDSLFFQFLHQFISCNPKTIFNQNRVHPIDIFRPICLWWQ